MEQAHSQVARSAADNPLRVELAVFEPQACPSMQANAASD